MRLEKPGISSPWATSQVTLLDVIDISQKSSESEDTYWTLCHTTTFVYVNYNRKPAAQRHEKKTRKRQKNMCARIVQNAESEKNLTDVLDAFDASSVYTINCKSKFRKLASRSTNGHSDKVRSLPTKVSKKKLQQQTTEMAPGPFLKRGACLWKKTEPFCNRINVRRLRGHNSNH